MKRKTCTILVITLAAVFLTGSLASADLIKEFAVGTRVKSWELLGDKNYGRTFNANSVQEKDERYPSNAHLLFLFCDYGGVSVEWDRYGATIDKAGALLWDSFTFALNFRHPVPVADTKIVPYGVLGLTYNMPRFDENNWWRYGWTSAEAYDTAQFNRAATADPDQALKTGRTRNFTPDDAWGWTYGFGVDLFVTKNLALNLDARWNRAVMDGHYSLVSDDGKTTFESGSFDYPLDTVSYSLGFRWFF